MISLLTTRLRLSVVLVVFSLLQGLVTVRCDACARGECQASAGKCCQPSAVECPLCRAAAAAADQTGSTDPEDGAPCRCAWKAKHSLPMDSKRSFAVDRHDATTLNVSPVWTVEFMPPLQAIGMQAAAVPIPERPARILFGVWRN